MNLNAEGIGKCSVPMWRMGLPAGFCDAPAYGEPPPSKRFMNYGAGEEQREDGRYSGYVPHLACGAHGGPPSRVFKDGNLWCAVFPEFTNLLESPAGFGDSPQAARKALQHASGRPST